MLVRMIVGTGRIIVSAFMLVCSLMMWGLFGASILLGGCSSTDKATAASNLSNVRTLVAESTAVDPARKPRNDAMAHVAEKIAADAAVDASITALTETAGTLAVTTPPNPVTPFLAIAGAIGAIFTTAKTIRRTFKDGKRPDNPGGKSNGSTATSSVAG